MLIERNGFKHNTATTLVQLRENCLGCKTCDGPCHILMQLASVPDILLGTKGANQ